MSTAFLSRATRTAAATPLGSLGIRGFAARATPPAAAAVVVPTLRVLTVFLGALTLSVFVFAMQVVFRVEMMRDDVARNRCGYEVVDSQPCCQACANHC